jgi:hypothetical protein
MASLLGIKLFTILLLALAVWMATFGIGGFDKIRHHRRNIRLIRAATEGAMPRDGEVSAAVGIIRALRDPINAPFSEHRCVIFEYQIYSEFYIWRNDTNRFEPDRGEWCSGFRMAPCAVRTTKGDEIMLLGFSDLRGFSETKAFVPYLETKDFV